MKLGTCLFVFKAAFGSSPVLGYCASLAFISTIVNAIILVPNRWAQFAILFVCSLLTFVVYFIRVKLGGYFSSPILHEIFYSGIRLMATLLLQLSLFYLYDVAISEARVRRYDIAAVGLTAQVVTCVIVLCLGLLSFFKIYVVCINLPVPS